jgi:hypothetical protein
MAPIRDAHNGQWPKRSCPSRNRATRGHERSRNDALTHAAASPLDGAIPGCRCPTRVRLIRTGVTEAHETAGFGNSITVIIRRRRAKVRPQTLAGSVVGADGRHRHASHGSRVKRSVGGADIRLRVTDAAVVHRSARRRLGAIAGPAGPGNDGNLAGWTGGWKGLARHEMPTVALRARAVARASIASVVFVTPVDARCSAAARCRAATAQQREAGCRAKNRGQTSNSSLPCSTGISAHRFRT